MARVRVGSHVHKEIESREVTRSFFDTGVSQAPKMFCRNATRKTPETVLRRADIQTGKLLAPVVLQALSGKSQVRAPAGETP